MYKQARNQEAEGGQQGARPAWEIFFTDDSGMVIERHWEDKSTGRKGTAWDKRGALWAGTTKGGEETLRGKLTLPNGDEVRLSLRKPREKRSNMA